MGVETSSAIKNEAGQGLYFMAKPLTGFSNYIVAPPTEYF
jgi:hypothetical protein